MQIILTAALLVLLGMTAGAQNLKLGYVDSQKIFEGLPEAQEAQKVLDAQLAVWQDSLETMSRNFQSEVETYQAQQGMMAEAKKEETLQRLTRMEQEIREYRNLKFGQTGEAARMRQTVLGPLQDKVLKAIQAVAKEEGLSFVFDKIEEATIVLYAQEKYDYTFKVLDMLKRGSK
ncbi:MAG: OmpH family outer membrane protein [Bacteroidota bacterium]|nr:OmpH family outer membrane protein [Bacteroidota bacterium]